jgi:hypothetical protein
MGALGVGEDASVGEFPVEKGKVRDEECLAVVPIRLLDRAGENARAQSAPNSLRCPRERVRGPREGGDSPQPRARAGCRACLVGTAQTKATGETGSMKGTIDRRMPFRIRSIVSQAGASKGSAVTVLGVRGLTCLRKGYRPTRLSRRGRRACGPGHGR